ncbi:MAG: hypothetical protein KF886_18985 [Candidatus Hydrogenedentes bacterium]|nr:hypothetical protein [Candidatus Hydrogenedentota bacterium]
METNHTNSMMPCRTHNPTYYRLVAVYLAAIIAPFLLFAAPTVWWTVAPCTVYSEQYDEAVFQSIQIGQSIGDVIAELGPPYRVLPVYAECWEYDGWSVFFNDEGVVEVDQLYQWDRKDLEDNMGELPPGVTFATLAGKTRGEMRARFGEANIDDGGSQLEQYFFYTHPSEGGMWADRTWKKRLLVVDRKSRRVTAKHSFWVVAGDPVT